MARFLRWKAIQDAAFIDEDDGLLKCWSESHVSEDFDQALRLQMKGWSLRWASYSNGGFQEGVSLTADDEVGFWVVPAEAMADYSSIDGKSTLTDVPNCCSSLCASGSRKDPSRLFTSDLSGPTVSPCIRRSRSWRTSHPTTPSLVRWHCHCSTGSWSACSPTPLICTTSNRGRSS